MNYDETYRKSLDGLLLVLSMVLGMLIAHGIWLHYVRDATCFTEAPVLTDEQVAEILYQLDDNKE